MTHANRRRLRRVAAAAAALLAVALRAAEPPSPSGLKVLVSADMEGRDTVAVSKFFEAISNIRIQ